MTGLLDPRDVSSGSRDLGLVRPLRTSPTYHPRGLRASGWHWAVVALLAAGLVGAGLFVTDWNPALPVPAGSPAGGSAAVPTPGGQPSCYPYPSPTASAILVPVPSPGQSLNAGGTISAELELGSVGYPVSAHGATVELPSVFATFPLASGSTAQLYFPPSSFSVTAAGWLAGSVVTRSAVESSGLQFGSGTSDQLSSQKIAVLANLSYGSLVLEVRWHWTLTQPNGSTQVGAWSVPTNASHWPTSVPSEFYPAPWVTVLSTNGPTETIGQNFSADLGGMVSARYFFLELESPSTGKVVQDQAQTSASGAASTTVVIAMLNYDRYLYPGTYLVHIHDACGALLVSVSENAVYAASAQVVLHLQPSSCGKLTFNGSGYGDGSTISVKPNATPYSYALPGCPGHSFRSWHFTGGLYPYAANRLLVSSDGSWTVVYS